MQYLKKEIREKIITAAIQEFKEQGYSDASIRNIANNAEISLGNIYRYFTNKEALYFAVINPFLENVKKAIDEGFDFQGRTMKEMSEKLIEFLTFNNDALMVIRMGNSIHYNNFVGYIEEVIAKKICEMMSEFPDIKDKIKNPDFYDAISAGFLTALFKVMRAEDPPNVQENKLRELITFYFGNMVNRFYHF